MRTNKIHLRVSKIPWKCDYKVIKEEEYLSSTTYSSYYTIKDAI